MRIVTTSAVALGAALLLGLAGTSPSFAKGHDQGFGAGLAGQAISGGAVADQVSRGGTKTGETGIYGSVVSDRAQAGGDDRDRSDDAGGNTGGNSDGGKGGGRGGRN